MNSSKIEISKFASFAIALAFLLTANNPCSADLMAHWTGNDTAVDATGHGHDGTVNGATYVAGVLGNAFSFDGINDSIIVDADSALEPANFSVALWVKAQQENHLRLLIDSTHGAGQAGWALQLNSANNISFAYGNGSTFPELTTGFNIQDGNFHHIAATLDGTTMRLYVDGTEAVNQAYTGTVAPSMRDIQIGRSVPLGRPFEGALDEVMIFDHVLTQGEVASLASVPEPNSLMLLGVAMASIAGSRRRRRMTGK